MGLRMAGKHAAALAESLAAMSLGPEDEALAEQARGLAVRLDTEVDAMLLVRHEGHYTTVLRGLAARSDLRRAREAADQAAARELEIARLRANPGPLERLREQHAADREGLRKLSARQAAQAARLLRSGLSVEQAAVKMKVQPLYVEMLLASDEDAAG